MHFLKRQRFAAHQKSSNRLSLKQADVNVLTKKERKQKEASHGKASAYDLDTGKADVLLKSMQFSNGSALGPHEAFLPVDETGSYRIVRR
jgi:hypothetical protein